jgi:hypothetical protein
MRGRSHRPETPILIGHCAAVALNAYGADNLLKLPHGAVCDPEKPLAFRRERNGAVTPHEQLHPEHVLQGANLPAHRGLRNAHVFGAKRDAHAPANGDKGSYEVHRRKTND